MDNPLYMILVAIFAGALLRFIIYSAIQPLRKAAIAQTKLLTETSKGQRSQRRKIGQAIGRPKKW